MNIHLLPKEDNKASIWSGGLTYEYLIYPKTANYSDRNFVFRVSSATIEKVPSEFTKFKGYTDIWLCLITAYILRLTKRRKYIRNMKSWNLIRMMK